MKKAYNVIKNIFVVLSLVCLFIFNTGCGLDTFYVISAPVNVVHQPYYTDTDHAERYFSFWTNEETDIAGFVFLGTDVYYKIYNSSSQMSTEVSVLQTLASDSEKSSTAPDKMMNPTSSGGYGYKGLEAKKFNKSVLIPSENQNRLVYIRLSDYQSLEAYSARILIGGEYGTNLYDSDTKVIPIRNTSDGRTFNFGRSGDLDKVPTSEDEDVKYTSSSSDGKWYIAMFAVAVGYDATYKNYYSNILYLGSVTIDSNSYDN